jgi:hypothetical protein
VHCPGYKFNAENNDVLLSLSAIKRRTNPSHPLGARQLPPGFWIKGLIFLKAANSSLNCAKRQKNNIDFKMPGYKETLLYGGRSCLLSYICDMASFYF